MVRPWFSFIINRRTLLLLLGIFENAQKSLFFSQKRPKYGFWLLITFLVHFHKYQVKEDVCASIDYIAESGPRMSQSIYSKLLRRRTWEEGSKCLRFTRITWLVKSKVSSKVYNTKSLKMPSTVWAKLFNQEIIL